MNRQTHQNWLPARARAACSIAATLAVFSVLGGCANIGDSFASPAFVDPAKYDLYDCEKLKAERNLLVVQANIKQTLIDKAKTGPGGTIIGEAVHRNDYISYRAQKKLADEVWVRNGCDAIMPPDPAPAPAPAAKPR